jgi:hypothetical protein
MKGWLKEIKTGNEGLNKNDPFVNDVRRHCIYLGKVVNQFFDIDYSHDFKSAFYEGEQVSNFQNWRNISTGNKYSRFESEGSILEVNIDFLLAFLKKSNMAMIVECEVVRQLKDYDYERLKETSNKIVKLYLICPDGEVKTLRGRHYKIG